MKRSHKVHRTLSRTVLFAIAGSVAMQAGATVNKVWAFAYNGLTGGVNQPYFASHDAAGAIYTLSLTTTSTHNYVTIRKSDHGGNKVWQTSIPFPLQSFPTSLRVDGMGQAIFGVNSYDVHRYFQPVVNRLSSAGVLNFAPSLSSALGGLELAVGADDGNNIYAAVSVTGPNGSTFKLLKYSPARVLIFAKSFPLQPMNAGFDRGGNGFVTGNTPSGVSNGGAEAQRFNLDGTVAWTKTAPTLYANSIFTIHTLTLNPGFVRGTFFLIDQIEVTGKGPNTFNFYVKSVNAAGTVLWTSIKFPGDSWRVSAGSLNDVYVRYVQYDNSFNQTPCIASLDQQGHLVAAKLANTSIIAANGTKGVWEVYKDPKTGKCYVALCNRTLTPVWVQQLMITGAFANFSSYFDELDDENEFDNWWEFYIFGGDGGECAVEGFSDN